MDWDDMARPWLEAAPGLEMTHKPVLDALLDAARLSEGEAILDVGSGTGPSLIEAARLIGPTGHVTGVDVAPPLLAHAAARVPDNVELVVADAGSHSFSEAQFDVVLSNFGIMFFEDNAAAFSNLRKAARPGARLAASVWGPPANNPWFSVPRAVVDRIVADVPRPDPAGPGPMRFGDPAPLITALTSAGWAPSVETLDISLTPPGTAEDVAALHMKVTAGMMLRGVEVSEDTLAQIEAALVDVTKGQRVNGAIRVPAEIHIVTATAV
ncbi:methyltransferase domain-containing protein [Hoeflea prorocentri]|uniref:Methyltransferase domain-containing protein n=1 Tax=Hoeflea prorocentri TaxID=1922333 RepID=A0A9X3UPB5_9HYPH|nr:methyltransferase domain-containing protein [Hoeflea prorocentri]MCY6382731.1 methyltransferase domain-containing protein [Hoeflea prorocentri]MDA5400531.1 methyltransferase domain-containing protein [Hoeflea prorocentri]